MTQAHVASEMVDALLASLSENEPGFLAWYQKLPDYYVATVLRPVLQRALMKRVNDLDFVFSRVPDTAQRA